MSAAKRWLAFECGESSAVVGTFDTQEEALAASVVAEAKQRADWGGQHSFEVFDLEAAGCVVTSLLREGDDEGAFANSFSDDVTVNGLYVVRSSNGTFRLFGSERAAALWLIGAEDGKAWAVEVHVLHEVERVPPPPPSLQAKPSQPLVAPS